MYRSAVIALVLVALAAGAAHADVVEERALVPVEVVDRHGAAVRQSIEVTIVRDASRARSPFLVLSHGRGGMAESSRRRSVAGMLPNARYFAAKGYVVLLPLRVGYGTTGGPDVENSGPCSNRDYAPVYEAAAMQTLRVIEHAKAQPYIDPTHGLVVGQSFGGATAIAVAAKGVPGIRAAINFAGGGGGNPADHPEQPCSLEAMSRLFASYGATSRVPTLWLYSQNDRYWGPLIPRRWLDGFVASGGKGEFVALPPHKSDGHAIFTGNPAAWRPAVEDFLRQCCSRPAE